jgi:LacI family transcriptional regulator
MQEPSREFVPGWAHSPNIVLVPAQTMKEQRIAMGNADQVKAKTTISDVARESGVSHATVSRVLNGDVHVKPKTRERVQQAMERLGYVVNRQARSLAGGRSHVIGILVPDLGTGYIGEIMRGIDDELDLTRYDMMLYTTHRREAKESSYVTSLTQGMADGLLIVLPRNPATFMQTLRQRNFPYVLIDHQGTNEQDHAVGATNWQGDRLAGYQAALRAHHLTFDSKQVYEGDFHQPDGYVGASWLLGNQVRPTAIFASNDVMAMSAMEAVRERGLRVPEDVSVLGFDDIPQSAHVHPALTTVRQPLEQMGRIAAQMLLDLLNNPDAKPRRIELPTELIIRDSCQAPLSCEEQGQQKEDRDHQRLAALMVPVPSP